MKIDHACGVKRVLILTAALLAPVLPAHAQPARAVPRYHLKAQVDAARKEVTASETVIWTNPGPEALSELVFHIYPNRRYSAGEQDFMFRLGGYFKVNPYPDGFPDKTMDILSVRQNGRPLVYDITGEDRTLLKVQLPAPLGPGEAVAVELDFRLFLPRAYGRYGWQDGIIKLSRWYPVMAVYGPSGWSENPFYPFHRPFFSESAFYDVDLTVPADSVVIHSGRQTGEEIQGRVKTLSFDTEQPVREFTLALSPDYLLLETVAGGVTVKSYYLPGDEKNAALALESVRDLMDYYTELFGPYPYKEFSLAPVPLGYGGEQMGNMAFIDTRVYRLPRFLKRYLDFIVAHETGHQWFFNVVGTDEFSEMWLEEGVNSYFISEYLEHKYGRDGEIMDWPSWLKEARQLFPQATFHRARDFRYKALIARTRFDHPIVDALSGFQEPVSIFSLTYGKGARVIGMLKEMMGPDAFAGAFTRIFEEYRFRNLGLGDFIRICEEESGRDLTPFFDQWLHTTARLNYAVSAVSGDRVELENKGGIRMPVDVTVDFADRSRENLVWAGEKKKETLSFPGRPRVTAVTVDPGARLLDIDQVDNHWPRKVYVKPVPVYLGLYDIPLFLPEDGYSVVAGPELAHSGLGVKMSVQRPYDWISYAGTDYEFGESLLHSRFGYQLKNVLKSQTALGMELSNTTDFDGGEEDVASGKVYLRRELWPAPYGITEINDHTTLYMIRNQRLSDGNELPGTSEDDGYLDYTRRKEAIVGAGLFLNRAGPYPDPRQGWTLRANVENAGHFLGAEEYFYRSNVDMSYVHPLTAQTRLAMRMDYGWGYPDDKVLFYIGGIDGLRGYKRKSVRGANTVMGNIEYRFPLLQNLDLSVADRLVGLEAVGGVVFFDAGQSWYSSFDGGNFQKDAGAGLRFLVNIGSCLEKVIVRLDVAQAIAEPKASTRFWLGFGHAF